MSQPSVAQVKQTLLEQYPMAYRLAAGLCGGAAADVATRVLRRAVVLGSRWPDSVAAERWFLRFTVLASREAVDARDGTTEWLPLTTQQREAVILVHGLKLDLHRAAAAMDCSTTAAANHLVAGVAQLREAGRADDWIATLPDQLAAVVPPPVVIAEEVARAVSRRRWRVWVRRVFVALAIAAAVASGWALWRVWPMLVY